jgi:hypothetical protein
MFCCTPVKLLVLSWSLIDADSHLILLLLERRGLKLGTLQMLLRASLASLRLQIWICNISISYAIGCRDSFSSTSCLLSFETSSDLALSDIFTDSSVLPDFLSTKSALFIAAFANLSNSRIFAFIAVGDSSGRSVPTVAGVGRGI